MKASIVNISKWIKEYLASGQANNVLNRKLSDKLIHRLQCDRKDENGVNISKKWLEHINKNLSKFDNLTDFESILDCVKELAVGFYGIGELTIYDTATCIGCPKNIYPNVVYIHAGTKKGAKALDIIGSKTVEKDVFVGICADFNKLEPAHIEDFLCIYAPNLNGEIEECNKKSCNETSGCCSR